MTERDPDDVEVHEVDADDLAHEVVEPDPDELPGPVPDDEREVSVDLDDEAPDVGDFDGNLDA